MNELACCHHGNCEYSTSQDSLGNLSEKPCLLEPIKLREALNV